jgi:hypothetical protein
MDREATSERAQERLTTSRERETKRETVPLNGFLALSKDKVRALLLCLQTSTTKKKKKKKRSLKKGPPFILSLFSHLSPLLCFLVGADPDCCSSSIPP